MVSSFLDGAKERLRTMPDIIGIYAGVVLLAYGFAMFNLTLAGDDWHTLSYLGFQYDWVISIGRWLIRIVWSLTDDSGFAPPFTMAFLCAAYLAVSIACCLCLGVERKGSYLIFACVLVCFPINAEPFSFKMLHLNFALGFFLATASGLMVVRCHEIFDVGKATRTAFLGLGAAVAFMLAASLYQPIALFACGIVLLRLVGFLREKSETRTMLMRSAGLLGVAAAVFGIGGGLYWGVFHAVSRITGIPLQDAGTYAVTNSFVGSWAELSHQIETGFGVLGGLLFAEQTLFPLLTKVAFLTATAVVAVVFALGWDESKAAGEKIRYQNGLVRASVFLGVVLLLLLAPLALGMVRRVDALRYNNLIGIALPHAMIYAIFYDVARDVLWRRGTAILAGIVIAIFAFEQNRASVTTFLLNRRDLSIASRMLERITANEAFAPFAAKGQATIVFYGDHLDDRDMARPFSVDQRKGIRVADRTMRTTLNCGPFNCQISRVPVIFGMVSESRMNYAVRVWPDLPVNVLEEEKQRLADRVKASHPWPAPDAVIFGTDVVVVMLQPPA